MYKFIVASKDENEKIVSVNLEYYDIDSKKNTITKYDFGNINFPYVCRVIGPAMSKIIKEQEEKIIKE